MDVVWTNKHKWHTGYSADSVEWCPIKTYANVLVCGTYQLDKNDGLDSTQTRLGKIYLFNIDQDATEIVPLQTVKTCGVLDQKWCYQEIKGLPTLAVVTSEGSLQLYQLCREDKLLELKQWIHYDLGEGLLALSVDWSTNKIEDNQKLVVSDSKGNVHVFELTGESLQKLGEWKAHGFEAWIAAFDYWNNNIFYTGGDDCLFKSFDVRMPDAPATLNKSHEAGVTSVRSHIDVEHQLISGSYDEKVRLWDTRNLKCCLTESNVNGGVWRLKWHPYKHHTVIAACMYGGFRVLNVDNEVDIICEYLEHESIAYGADWKFDNSDTVATCSFYDCMMHIGRLSIGF